MNRKTGSYITKSIGGEKFSPYIPNKLPPVPAIELENLYTKIDKAMQYVSELNGLVNSIPNVSLFMYMYQRKEALLSSQIEGTQSSFSDLLLFEK